jgi:hypothetical protein
MSCFSQLFLFGFLALALCCRGATPEPTGVEPMPDAAGPLWPPIDGGAEALACSESHRIPLVYQPSDVLVLFDRSQSMSTELGTGTRYSVLAGLLGDLAEVYQDKLRFGFQPFPDPDCPPEQLGCCASPPTLGLEPGAAADLRAAMARAAPTGGSTPTAGALLQARQYFAGLTDGGDRQRYVLLATDGWPSCDGTGALMPDVSDTDRQRVSGPCHDALVQVDALVAAGIGVLVLGVGPGLDADPNGPPSCLEEIASRGMGGKARQEDRPWFLSGADPERLESALQALFGGIKSPGCQWKLDAIPPDPAEVAVFLDGHLVPRNRNYGWDFDSPGDLTHVQFFGEYCRRLDRFQVTSIEVRYGCPPCAGEGLRCE